MYEIIGAQLRAGKLEPEQILKQVQEFSSANQIEIQLFDAEFVFGKDHLVSAFEHAKRAIAQDSAISTSLGMEVLLYAAGEYQIKNAIKKLGLSQNTTKIAFFLAGYQEISGDLINDLFSKLELDGLELERDDEVLMGDRSTLERFGISREELAAVPEDRWLDLVLEKVALLDIIK